MFTGIVTHRGRLTAVERQGVDGGRVRVVVEPEGPLPRTAVGDSVAVDGVCLTAVEVGPERVAFDVIPETLRKTSLGDRLPGDLVHLEPALRLGDPLGGHWVQGHVDGTGVLVAREAQGEDLALTIAVPDELLDGLLPKGSVTLDGVSLTVGEVGRDPDGEPAGLPGRFRVYLIPHTVAVTGLGTKAVGERVNVEVDVLGRWVKHHLERGVRPLGDR
ncbi:MAG: riboflavin synthase [Planctomycetota bacterium]